MRSTIDLSAIITALGLVVLLSPCAESAPPCTAAEASPLTTRESRCWPGETQTSCCCPGARARQPPPTRAHSGRIDGCIPHTNTAGSWAPSGGRMRAMRWPASAGAGLTTSFTGTWPEPTVQGNLLATSPHTGATWRTTSSHRPRGATATSTCASELARPPPPRTPSGSLASCERIVALGVSARCWMATAQLGSR